MTRAQELDAAIAETETALAQLKALRDGSKSREKFNQVRAALSGVVGRISRITTARYSI